MHKDPIESLFAGSKQFKLPSCHSTNAVASDLLTDGNVSEGTVVITDRQTGGRGQRGNTWESHPGKNLTLSIILKPAFLPVFRQFDLTIISSLALTSTLTDLGLPDALIKWPNDIYYGEQKIAGILIENTVRSNQLEWSVLGIGLNVNQCSFPVKRATSINLELNREIALELVLQHLLQWINVFYGRLKSGAGQTLRTKYMERLMWLNEQRNFGDTALGTSFSGIIKRISPEGKLIIIKEHQEMAFDFKQVSFLS